MTQNTDFPDELPPKESQVVSKIEAALEKVLEDFSLDPNQKSIKYEKYVYLTATKFPPYEEPAISYSWFQWGISTLAGEGGETSSKDFYTTTPSSKYILQAESGDIESFIKNGLDEFPIQDWWEESEFVFLRNFYETYAETHEELYLANINMQESLDFVEKTVQREEDLISEQTYLNACKYTKDLSQEIETLPYLTDDYGVVQFFTEIYKDVILQLVDTSTGKMELGQKTAVNRLVEFYQDLVWPLLSHSLSEATASGPNSDYLEDWASDKHKEILDDILDSDIKEICATTDLLREFKSYPDLGNHPSTNQRRDSPVKTVLEYKEAEPIIAEFIEEYSFQKLATIVDLTPEYAAGNLTYRGVARTVDVSYEAAFEMLEVLVPLLVGEQDKSTLRPNDIDDKTRSEYLADINL
jgi:hypothetical protein